jgi:hypothetical protein
MRNAVGALLITAAITACSGNQTNQEIEQTMVPEAEDLSAFEAQGLEIVKSTFGVLSSALQLRLEDGEVTDAVSYCNAAAYPLTDSLSKAHGAEIRRTSNKVRNPANALSDIEKPVFEAFLDEMNAGTEPRGKAIRMEDGMVHYFQPIFLQPMCMNCHGVVGEQVKTEDYQLIASLYPNDQAVGYKPGELRGMWSITFKQ